MRNGLLTLLSFLLTLWVLGQQAEAYQQPEIASFSGRSCAIGSIGGEKVVSDVDKFFGQEHESANWTPKSVIEIVQTPTQHLSTEEQLNDAAAVDVADVADVADAVDEVDAVNSRQEALKASIAPSAQVQPATYLEAAPGETEKPAEETEQENAESRGIDSLKHSSQLTQLYQSGFGDRVPVELVDSLAKETAERRKKLEDLTEKKPEEEARLKSLVFATSKFDNARRFKTEIENLLLEIRAAPDQIKNLKTSKDPTLTKDELLVGLQASLQTDEEITSGKTDKIEAQLKKTQQDLDLHKAHLQQVETSIEETRKRLADAKTKKQKTQQDLEEATKLLAASGFDPNKPMDATMLSQLASAISLTVRLERDQVESQRDIAIEQELLPLQKEQASRHVRQTEEEVATLTKLRDEAIRILKTRLAEKARIEAALAHPRLKELAKTNTELAQKSTEMIRKLQEAEAELLAVREKRTDQADSFEKLKKKVEVAGTTQTVGLLLRNYRRHLPSIARSYSRVQSIEAELPALNLAWIEFEESYDQVKELLNQPEEKVNIEAVLAIDRHNDLVVEPPVEVTPELRRMALDSLDTKHKLLEQLAKDYRIEIDKLSELESETRSLIKETNECRFFIDKHVLWIRSSEPLAVNDLQRSVSGVQSVMAINNWSDLTLKFTDGLTNNPFGAGVGLFVFVGLIAFRGRLISRLKRINAQQSSQRMTLLLRSLFLSLLLASIYPAVLIIAGLVLKSPYDDSSLKGAASQALLIVGPSFFIASLLYRVSMPGGLAETRLQWNPSLTSTLRKLVMMLTLFCFPLIFVYELMESYNEGAWSNSLGRLGLIGAMIVLGLANMRAFRGLMKYMKEAPPHKIRKLLMQWRWLWLAFLVGGPIALAAFAAMGYSYSAQQLGGRILMTFWCTLLIIFSYSLTTRVVLLAQQAIAAGIRRRRYFERDFNDPAEQKEQEQQELEIERVHEQMQRLLRVSAFAVALIVGWQLWSEVLPAVQILEKVELWKATTYVATKSVGDGAEAQEILEPRRVAITLNHALLCCGILGLTFVLSRNLPGLLQITFLNRLPIDRGGKYAISIVMRYVVAITGAVLAFRMIGFSWDSLQWLVAAMSVGLGFGLQEIFGNFVSGLIILFERPIRVGDMVTVNGTTGWVTRIQLRATTITDLDRRELVVPNKKFITDDIINWTLTDPITRMTVHVGVAYGSDTKLAEQTLLRVAREHRMVLNDPKPLAHFSSFGDSSLDFQLKVFIPNREIFHDVQHEIHMAIDAAFRQLGIEIAFPQQDLHIRSVDAQALIRTATVGGEEPFAPSNEQTLRRDAA